MFTIVDIIEHTPVCKSCMWRIQGYLAQTAVNSYPRDTDMRISLLAGDVQKLLQKDSNSNMFIVILGECYLIANEEQKTVAEFLEDIDNTTCLIMERVKQELLEKGYKITSYCDKTCNETEFQYEEFSGTIEAVIEEAEIKISHRWQDDTERYFPLADPECFIKAAEYANSIVLDYFKRQRAKILELSNKIAGE